jgi:hypothetical protein
MSVASELNRLHRASFEAPDAVFLKLAVRSHRARILTALEEVHFASSAYFDDLLIIGVPGVLSVALFAWPEPLGRARRIAIDVVRADRRALREPVSFTFELEPEERPSLEETPPVEVTLAEVVEPSTGRRQVVLGPPGRQARWTQILPAEAKLEREVQRLEKDGSPVLVLVDTRTYSYRMTCACGRVRYSKPNSLHQIGACRVCTRGERLRKRALVQYQSRRRRRG